MTKQMSLPEALREWAEFPEFKSYQSHRYEAGRLVDDLADAADKIERLTQERDTWASKWHRIRAELAELKYPGMKGVVRPLASAPNEPNEPRCHCGKYLYEEGMAYVIDDAAEEHTLTGCTSEPKCSEKSDCPAFARCSNTSIGTLSFHGQTDSKTYQCSLPKGHPGGCSWDLSPPLSVGFP